MAGLIYELIEQLETMAELYDSLLAYSKQKNGALVSNDVDLLQSITSSENELVGKISGLDKKRAELMADIANVLNQNKDELTITKLSQLMKNQPEESKKLEELAQRLYDCSKELKDQNERNGVLIQQGLEFVEFTLNTMRSGAQPEPPSYGNTTVQNQSSLFDTKQ